MTKKAAEVIPPAPEVFKRQDIWCDTEVAEERAPGDKPGLMKFTVSTEDRDRHGDVVVAEGWRLANFKKNPVMLWAHDYSRPPIGKAVDISVDGNKLRAVVEFVPAHIDPFAEQIRQLYLGRFMRTTSVGFIPYKAEPLTDDDKKQRPESGYGRRLSGELLEFSAVPVPSNPMALQNGFMAALAKSFETRPSGVLVPKQEKAKLADALGWRVTGQELRCVRAAAALALGARGGCGLNTTQERDIQILLLAEEAGNLGDASLIAQAQSCLRDGNVDENLLREAFADVWDEELLDMVARAKALEPAPIDPLKRELSAGEAELAAGLLAGMQKTLDAVKALK